MILKGTAFVMFTVCGFLAGFCFTERKKLIRDCSREIHAMLIHISVCIRCKGMNVFEIFHELKSSDMYKNLTFLENLPDEYKPGSNFHVIWDEQISKSREIGDEEKSCLISFGNSLGISDTEGQLMSLETAIEAIGSLEARRNEEYLQKSKLWQSVGTLFGAMLGIILI